jgi:hypothetical protein
VVYIAGPISGPNVESWVRNLHRFFAMENMLWRHGFSPINPAADLIAAIMHGQYEYEDYLDKDESLVKRSDYIYMLPGWECSEGASREYAWALKAQVVPVESIAQILRYVEAKGEDWIDALPVDADA